MKLNLNWKKNFVIPIDALLDVLDKSIAVGDGLIHTDMHTHASMKDHQI